MDIWKPFILADAPLPTDGDGDCKGVLLEDSPLWLDLFP